MLHYTTDVIIKQEKVLSISKKNKSVIIKNSPLNRAVTIGNEKCTDVILEYMGMID